jgi:signal transduction histidine kinase
MSVLRYLHRTNEPLLVADVVGDDRFARDPYFIDVDHCAVLAVPILSRGALRAVLLLENRLIRGAFSTERLDAVTLIAGQLAVSLDNAQLYADLEHRVAQRTAALEVANRELEAFSYSVSHDLKAPVRAIRGFCELLAQSYPAQAGQQSRHYLDVIAGSAERMAELIDNLLALHQMSRRRLTVRPLDLLALTRQVFAELREQVPDRQITLRCLDAPTALGDAVMLRALLVNLLSNAVKFTAPRPEAVIEVGGRTEGEHTLYWVRDNGIGFDMTSRDRIFEAFERLHPTQQFPGTGIGLATVKRITERHHGQVWAESTLDQGTTIYFTLPNSPRTPRSSSS